MCGPQMQLTTSLFLKNLTTCFGPYGPSSSDNFRNGIQYVLIKDYDYEYNGWIAVEWESFIFHDYEYNGWIAVEWESFIFHDYENNGWIAVEWESFIFHDYENNG
jgi:hypothetical protein